jgi:uncharacterized protein (DUF2236 family)
MDAVRDRLGQMIFARVAGPDGPRQRERIHDTPGPRWFDPDSPIARVHRDAAMFIGGIRAVLLQTMHPVAMTAVAENSGFRVDMWGRLARTSSFLAVTTFGPAQYAEQAVTAVRSIHEKVRGTMPDGTPYVASDPHLLAWVHAAEADSFLRSHTVYGDDPLTQDERDTYVAQVGEVSARLGVLDPPTTEAGLSQVLRDFRPELRGTRHAREAVRHLILHPDLPLPARAPYGVLMAAGIGLMPWWTRLPLRLPLLPGVEQTAVRAAGEAATRTIRWAMSPREVETVAGSVPDGATAPHAAES